MDFIFLSCKTSWTEEFNSCKLQLAVCFQGPEILYCVFGLMPQLLTLKSLKKRFLAPDIQYSHMD